MEHAKQRDSFVSRMMVAFARRGCKARAHSAVHRGQGERCQCPTGRGTGLTGHRQGSDRVDSSQSWGRHSAKTFLKSFSGIGAEEADCGTCSGWPEGSASRRPSKRELAHGLTTIKPMCKSCSRPEVDLEINEARTRGTTYDYAAEFFSRPVLVPNPPTRRSPCWTRKNWKTTEAGSW